MPQSLARVNIHLIFSTKNRVAIIDDGVRDSLHAYMATVLRTINCAPDLINSVEDHVHILFDLGRTVTIAKVVEEVKKDSSKWIKTHGPKFREFAWQAGYGAFAVSVSNIPAVRDYIAGQREHHQHQSFQDEFRAFLHRHGVEFDDRYVWD